MLHGQQHLAADPRLRFVAAWRALLVFALCLGAVLGLVAWAGAA
jgi:hypothetical protein